MDNNVRNYLKTYYSSSLITSNPGYIASTDLCPVVTNRNSEPTNYSICSQYVHDKEWIIPSNASDGSLDFRRYEAQESLTERRNSLLPFPSLLIKPTNEKSDDPFVYHYPLHSSLPIPMNNTMVNSSIPGSLNIDHANGTIMNHVPIPPTLSTSFGTSRSRSSRDSNNKWNDGNNTMREDNRAATASIVVFSRTGLGATLRRTTRGRTISELPTEIKCSMNMNTNDDRGRSLSSPASGPGSTSDHSSGQPLTRLQRIQHILYQQQRKPIPNKETESEPSSLSIHTSPTRSSGNTDSTTSSRPNDSSQGSHIYPSYNYKYTSEKNTNNLVSLDQALSSAAHALRIAEKYLCKERSFMNGTRVPNTTISNRDYEKTIMNNTLPQSTSISSSSSRSSLTGDGIYAPSPKKLSKLIHAAPSSLVR